MSYNGELYNICLQVKRKDVEQHYAELNFWFMNKTFWREIKKQNFVCISWGKKLGVGGKKLLLTSYFLLFFTVLAFNLHKYYFYCKN